MPRLLRMTVVFLLTASLAATAVVAAPFSGGQPRRSAIASPTPMNLVAQVLRFLSELWFKNGAQGDPNGAWTKNGSQADPSGSPLPPPSATPTGDNGSQMDPNGLH